MIVNLENGQPIREPFAVQKLKPLPKDLFTPGGGTPPPKLAGRDEEILQIGEVLTDKIKEGKPPQNAILLHGARGMGKTCLMEWIATNHCKNIETIKLTTSAMKSCATAALHIVKEGKTSAEGTLYVSGANLAGLMGGNLAQKVALAPQTILDAIRAKLDDIRTAGDPQDERKNGLLICLDEVHSIKSDEGKETLRELLQAMQSAIGESKQWPVGLIMAGTPDAYDHLKGIDATFVNRMIGSADRGNMPIGCLDDDGVRDALDEPFLQYHRSVDKAVSDWAIDATSGYAHFVQLFGEALCRTMAADEHRGDRVTIKDAEDAWGRFQGYKQYFYDEIVMELKATGTLEAAVCVINEMHGKGTLTDDEVKAKCIEGIRCRSAANLPDLDDDQKNWAQGGNAAMDQIIHAGLIWGDRGAASMEFGFNIPSLARHTQDYALNRSPHEHLRMLAAGES